MRSIPGMTVVVPSDDVEAKAAVRAAIETDGPFYIRFGRSAVPVVNDNEDYKFELGKAVCLREGKDIVIFAHGVCVAECLDAADSKDVKKVFTCEEHSIIGGLGSAVCEVLAENCPKAVTRIGINDEFGQSASAGVLMAHYGLDSKGIYAKVKENL